MATQDNDPYKDVKDAAEQLTKARLAKADVTVENDLRIAPMVQAVTPADEKSKKANTGGISVQGSPEAGPVEQSDGFTDHKPADLEK